METIAQNIELLNSTKSRLAAEIEAKGVTVGDIPFSQYPDKVAEISIGGSGGWSPQPDWPDIDAMLENDPDPNVVMYVMLIDAEATFNINPNSLGSEGAYYKTSDGATYTGNATHTWDRSQDIPCNLGYKTRWVAIYNTNKSNTNVNLQADLGLRSIKWVVGSKDANARTFIGSSNGGFINRALECINWKGTANATAIGTYAFYNCSSLSSITIPTGIESIAINSFYSCTSLLSIEIPQGVISIGNAAFYNCIKLQSITFPQGLTSMGTQIFQDCESIKQVTLPRGIISIPSSTFRNCSSLFNIVIPNGITSIGSNAFSYCMGLQLISIPLEINSILSNVFEVCQSLIVFKIEPGWIAVPFSIASSTNLSYSGLIDLGNNLGDNTGNPTVTITLGTTNLAKLSADEKAIFTNKNYTLA